MMTISNKKRVVMCVVLVLLFTATSVLMVSSINLFSLSKKDVNLEYSDILDKIDAESLIKVLKSSDKLKLINYYIEYQNLKANIKNLSRQELNRLFYLADDLSNYFSKEDLGISDEMVDDALNRYEELSHSLVGSDEDIGVEDPLNNMLEKRNILNNIDDMRKEVDKLYKNKKISEKSYNDIINGLSSMEYKVNLSSFDKKDLQVDLNNISSILDSEKSSFGADVDLSAFSNMNELLKSVQSEVDGIQYVSDFINKGVGNSLDGADYSKLTDIVNQIDMESFSNIIDFANKNKISIGDSTIDGTDEKSTETYPVDFSKTIQYPNIEVEGSLEDAWNVNVDASGLSLDNMLAPLDKSLINVKGIDELKNSLVNVKLPNIDDIISTTEPIDIPTITPTTIPTIVPTIVPTEIPTTVPTITPTTVPTDTPTTVPTITPTTVPTDTPTTVPIDTPTTVPTITPTTVPTDTPTTVPTEAPTTVPTDTPTIAPTDVPTEEPTSEPGENILGDLYKKYIDKNMMRIVLPCVGFVILLILIKNKNKILKNISIFNKSQNKEEEEQIEENNLPKNYKQMTIDEGKKLLTFIKERYQKGRAELTPREVIYMFLERYEDVDYKKGFEFLRKFEEIAFYTAEVDETYYIQFCEVCEYIYDFIVKAEEGKEEPVA